MTFMFDKQSKSKKKGLDDLVERLTISQEAEDDFNLNLDEDLDLGLDTTETPPEQTEPPSEDTSTPEENLDNKEEQTQVDPLDEKNVTGEEQTSSETETADENAEPEALAVQPISNEPKPLIFLAGTCSGSNWRDKFMEELKDAPFNPYIKDVEWTPQAAQNEVAMRNAAAKIVFGITPKQTGPLTIFELGVSIISSPDRTVVMIVDEDEGDTWTEHTKKAIDVIRASCEAQKVPIFDNPEQCIAFLNGEGEDFNEEIKPEEGSTTSSASEPQAEEVNAVEEETPIEETSTEPTGEEVAPVEETPPESEDLGTEEPPADESEESPSPDEI